MKSRAESVSHKSAPERSATEEDALSFGSLPHLLSFGALLLALFLAPSQFSGFWPASFDYLPQSLFSGLTSVAALMLALAPHAPARRSPISWCLAALLCWMLFVTPATVYWHDTVLEVARVGSAIAWFWIARDLLKEQFTARAGLILGAVALGTLWIVAGPITGFLQTRTSQLAGYFANNNLYANYCAMAFPCVASFTIALRRTVPEKARAASVAAGIVLALVVAFGLVVSASKGGLMALLAGSVAWLCIALRARGALLKGFVRARPGLVLAGVLAVVILGGAVGVKTVGPRLLKARGSENHSTMFRVYTWRATEKMIAERPLFGWGAGSFPAAMARFSETGYTRTAHQSWLQLAAENGVPAVLLLGAACLMALSCGWRAARTPRWSEAAAGTGALVALMVHGCVDAGWGASSIVLLMMLSFALLDRAADSTSGTAPTGANDTAPDAKRSNLRLPWLGAVLLLGAASWVAQRAASGEELRFEVGEASSRGDGSAMLRLSDEAVAADPLGTRMRTTWADVRVQNGSDLNSDWHLITRLRPTDAQLWRRWAEYRAGRGEDAKTQFDTAVRLAPNDSRVLRTRGEWLLSKGDPSGWKDLERIAALLDAPYGKYQATPELNVDIDAVHALLRLARRDIEAKNPKGARVWITRVAPMIKQAQDIAPQQQAMAKAMQGTGVDLEVPKGLDELAAELRELQAKL